MTKKTKTLNFKFWTSTPCCTWCTKRLILELDGEVVEKADPHILAYCIEEPRS